jgi:DNA-binding CsgD family transcriptional regulator
MKTGIGLSNVTDIAPSASRDRALVSSKLSSLAPHLNVLWLAQDEVAQYGIAALLDLVACVAAYEVCVDGGTVERRLGERRFDVCVLPARSAGPSLAELVSGRGAKLVLTLPGDQEPHRFLANDPLVDYWIPEERLSLNTLRAMFDRLSASTAPRTEPAVSDERTLRILQKVTERERSVLRLVVHGRSNQQIARSLGISIHGVKRHVSNLLLKFDCANRTELALVASQLQIDLTRERVHRAGGHHAPPRGPVHAARP